MVLSQPDSCNDQKRPQGHLRDHERFDLARVRDMRADTEIDHGATSVHRRRRSIRYLRCDEVLFVFIVLHWL
jgi:hypothetical protein